MVDAIRGAVSFAFIAVNTVFWSVPIYLLGAFRLLLPKRWRVACGTVMFRAVDGWVECVRAMTKVLGTVRISTDIAASAGQGELRLDRWYLVVANHQTWADILVLVFALNGRIPQFKFFTKRELIWVPFIGLALKFLDFPFVRRYGRERLAKAPELREHDRAATRKALAGVRERPTSVLSFLEGTRFTMAKRDAQESPYQALLKPKIGGFLMVRDGLADQLEAVVDVTIVYPGESGQAPGFWDFLCGRCSEVKLRARTFSPPEGDAQAVRDWLEQLWREKDRSLTSARRG